MKKGVLFLVSIFTIVIFANSLNIADLNGAYDVMKAGKDVSDYEFMNSFELRQKENRTNYSYAYEMLSENRSNVENIEFYVMNGRNYATISTNDTGVNKIYRVIDNALFYLTLQNVDVEDDKLIITYNRAYNDFDYEEYYKDIMDETGDDLKYELYRLVVNHKSLGYKPAKVEMFGKIDNDENGDIHCVYTDLVVHSKYPKNEVMNCEHSWPQSKLGNSSFAIKRGDLFHLYPTDSRSNSRRSNYPFGNVEKIRWEKDGSKVGSDDNGKRVFEPRDDHKGDVARAMFYMAVRYRMDIDEKQEKTLREWSKNDPVSEKELYRNGYIQEFQHTRNPFIDHPEFVERIDNF